MNPQSANQYCSRQHLLIFFHCFSVKIRLDVSSESSTRQWIHMKNEVLLSAKDKSKKLICHLLQFLFGTLRVKALKVCELNNDKNVNTESAIQIM